MDKNYNIVTLYKMGNGSGPGRINSRVYTNSFATKYGAEYRYANFLHLGNSFYGLSKPQYSHSTYYQLANNGAGAGARGDRWTRSQGYQPISFIPPTLM
jgi:hypothetical protein